MTLNVFLIYMNYSSSYIPVYTKPEDRDFLSYLDNLKYDNAIKNPDKYIKNVVIKYFDIIHHDCRGDISYDYYQTVQQQELENYKTKAEAKLLASCFKNHEKTKQKIFFERDVVKNYFLSK